MKKESRVRKTSPKEKFILDFCNKVYGLDKHYVVYSNCSTNPVQVFDYCKVRTKPFPLFDIGNELFVFADRSSTTKKTYVKFKWGDIAYVKKGSKEADNLVKRAKRFLVKRMPLAYVDVKLVPPARGVLVPYGDKYKVPEKDMMYLELVCSGMYPWQ